MSTSSGSGLRHPVAAALVLPTMKQPLSRPVLHFRSSVYCLYSFQGRIIALDSSLDEVKAGDGGILFQRPLNLTTLDRLVEVGHTVARAKVINRGISRRPHAVKCRLETIIAPAHKEVATARGMRGCISLGREEKRSRGGCKSAYMLQMISPSTGSILVHVSPSPNSVKAPRPGQISSPLSTGRWNSSVRRSQSACAPPRQ